MALLGDVGRSGLLGYGSELSAGDIPPIRRDPGRVSGANLTIGGLPATGGNPFFFQKMPVEWLPSINPGQRGDLMFFMRPGVPGGGVDILYQPAKGPAGWIVE